MLLLVVIYFVFERSVFAPWLKWLLISPLLAYSIQQFGVDMPVYRQYCPMAFHGESAYWISGEEEIRNPYLPEAMLRYGERVESLHARP